MPMLAGLLNRRVTWRGAAAGIVAGFVSGISLFLVKTFVLVDRVDPAWLRYDFEAITILDQHRRDGGRDGDYVTLLERVTAEDREQIAAFFRRLDTPVRFDAVGQGDTASGVAVLAHRRGHLRYGPVALGSRGRAARR